MIISLLDILSGAKNTERSLRRDTIDHGDVDPIGSIKNAGKKFIGYFF